MQGPGPASTRSSGRSSKGSPGTTKKASTPRSTTYRPPSTNATSGEAGNAPRSPPETRSPDSRKLGAAQSCSSTASGFSLTVSTSSRLGG
jgi:hypothetical protein